MVANHRGGGESSVIVTTLLFLTTWTSAMTALWINNPGFDTYHRHRHRGGMLTKTPPPTELQIPATVTTLFAANGISREGDDESAQHRRSVVYDCLVF